MTCTHRRWVLGLPRDGIVTGRCRDCGAVRTWPASPPGLPEKIAARRRGTANARKRDAGA